MYKPRPHPTPLNCPFRWTTRKLRYIILPFNGKECAPLYEDRCTLSYDIQAYSIYMMYIYMCICVGVGTDSSPCGKKKKTNKHPHAVTSSLEIQRSRERETDIMEH